MREEDAVVLLYGSATPHILRPQRKEGEYLYLGTAWIEDIRSGKLGEDVRTGKFRWADFLLI
jgi:hypothetical protein